MNLRFVSWSILALCLASGCDRGSESPTKKEAPAEVAHHVDEQQLNTVRLTSKAEERLGLALAEVQIKSVQPKRMFGGEVVIPSGRAIVVAAPLAGTVTLPAGTALPTVGGKVAAATPFFDLKPLLTPERDVLTPADRIRIAQTKADIATAQMAAQREVDSAAIRVQAAQIAFERASHLLETKAGSQRSVDEAEANLRLAEQAADTAKARSEFLTAIELDEVAGELAPRTIAAPVAGVVQRIDVAPGETVIAGDPLFEIVQLERVWIRVPVYAGALRKIDAQQGAQITEYGADEQAPSRLARYVSAPPSANALATTVDLFFEMDNADERLHPGQRVQAALSLTGHGESLVAPFRAIVYDVQGGAWVYAQTEPHVYARRRVAVRYVDGEDAVLADGPTSVTKVVTDGAAELFGAE
ncbi:MAG: efflux RND transporter periplasmic adaptor subunit, partial [Planctomycetales bacterium]|nr:efflux RND transporter periplasmic adaptor subunit [Planctomycetales bacterium]